VPQLVPYVLSATTFMGGILLLFSGATPATEGRLQWLKDFLLLPVIEISHFFGSLVGLGCFFWREGCNGDSTLLMLSRSFSLALESFSLFSRDLTMRRPSSYWSCLGYFSPVENISIARHLSSANVHTCWMIAITLVFLCSVWLGLFSYKHVEYSGELWWRFTLLGDASRSLRATVGLMGVTLAFAIARLLHPALPEPALPGTNDLEKHGPL